MINFIPFGQTITDADKRRMRSYFDDPKIELINRLYNNATHFSSPLIGYDINTFLREIRKAIHNKSDVTVEIMGNEHSEPFGHSSYLIGQYNEYGEFVPARVKDRYIRFRVVSKKSTWFNAGQIFHYLIDVPSIEQLGMPVYNQPVMGKQFIPYQNLIPISHYKRLNIDFI